jgi:dihydrofolate reductase
MNKPNPILAVIWAQDQASVIGVNNALPWKASQDLNSFKANTVNHTVIMGAKTWESLEYRPLPNRINIVVSKTLAKSNFIITRGIGTVFYVNTLQDAIDLHDYQYNTQSIATQHKAFVIGGVELIHEALPLADEVYFTRINKFVQYQPTDIVTRTNIQVDLSQPGKLSFNNLAKEHRTSFDIHQEFTVYETSHADKTTIDYDMYVLRKPI